MPFGDVALMSEDCVRTATIIAEEVTDLLVVDRALYNRAVKEVLAKEYEDKVAFINNNPLFSAWTPRYKKQLTMAMYKEEFTYNTTLVKQGEPVEVIYFLIRYEAFLSSFFKNFNHHWQMTKPFSLQIKTKSSIPALHADIELLSWRYMNSIFKYFVYHKFAS